MPNFIGIIYLLHPPTQPQKIKTLSQIYYDNKSIKISSININYQFIMYSAK